MTTANRGMFAETIINRTIDFYKQRSIGLIEKRNIPFQIVKVMANNMFIGKLLTKSTVDYTGFINDCHIEFEVKETKSENFSVNLIQPHQYEFLLNCSKMNIKSFVIVYFHHYEEFFLLSMDFIQLHTQNASKTIKYETIKEKCCNLPIIYPGIIDIKTAILKTF